MPQVTEMKMNSISSLLDFLLNLACIISGVALFSGLLVQGNTLFLVGIITFFVSLLVRKFITKPITDFKMSIIGYFFISFALVGSVYSLIEPHPELAAALPNNILPTLAPYMIILIVIKFTEKLSINKNGWVTIASVVIAVFLLQYFSKTIINIIRNNSLISDLIIGSPAVYMFSILFGFNEHTKKGTIPKK